MAKKKEVFVRALQCSLMSTGEHRNTMHKHDALNAWPWGPVLQYWSPKTMIKRGGNEGRNSEKAEADW